MSAPTAEKSSGWYLPASGRRYHYIDDGRSLCGGWLYFGDRFTSPRPEHKCKACARKLS